MYHRPHSQALDGRMLGQPNNTRFGGIKIFAAHSEGKWIPAGEVTDGEEAGNRHDGQHQPFQFRDVKPGLKLWCIRRMPHPAKPTS